VALNLATAAHLNVVICSKTAVSIGLMMTDIRMNVPAACLHEAAAAEALLRLFIRLCRRPHLAGAAEEPSYRGLEISWAGLCSMPGARKLPAGTVVELVLQLLMADISTEFPSRAAVELLHPLRPATPSHRLALVLVKRLLELLQGPTAAAATAAYQPELCLTGTILIMVWLARQPGAGAAAAELGLTAADVRDPAAAALLFGGQPREGDVQLMA
jgi:hypothetical protein